MGVSISGPAAAPPVILGLANAASYAASPIAPGEIVTIAGTDIGPAASASLALDPNGNVATTLGGVQVLFGPWTAPLIYVSANQINAVKRGCSLRSESSDRRGRAGALRRPELEPVPTGGY
jgi:hypothetical protein